jgi:DNA polymerase elongation subunit (family B)
MTDFWTSCHLLKDTVYVRGYRDGRPFEETVEYHPYLFVEDSRGDYRTAIDDLPAKKIDFGSVSEAREFVQSCEGVSNRKIHGLQHYLYTFLRDEFSGEVEYDLDLVRRGSIDIEVDTEGSYPNMETADKEILSIALSVRQRGQKRTLLLGLKPHKPENPDVSYVMCRNETELLESFLEFWNDPDWTPDVLTGWYIEGFDVPYIVRRIGRVLGSSKVKLLSPWRIVRDREIARGKTSAGNQGRQVVYELYGISILDYMELYKKFSFKNHESYKLDHIASVELGKKKVDYSEYGSLDNLYRLNPDLFYTYNLEDIFLVDQLDDKLGLIDLVLTFAYDSKIAFNDTMTTTRPWDVIIHNHLLDKKIVVPDTLGSTDDHQIIGGYVKEVEPGMYKGVVNYDFDSLYPHLIMGWNISPETCVGKVDFDAIASFARGTFDRDVEDLRPILEEKNAILCGNGYLFSRDRRGFLPEIMEMKYANRVKYKKQMQEYKKLLKETGDKKKYGPLVARYNNLQMANKLILNSGFGATASIYFRWFATYVAESITSSGQMSTMWVEREINKYLNQVMKTGDVDYVAYADTDSLYLCLGSFLDKYGLWEKPKDEMIEFLDQVSRQRIEPRIHEICGALTAFVNCPENKLHMKREHICDSGVWTAKKRYILNVWDSEGIRNKEPEVKVTGIESVRSSTPMICRDSIKKALKIMLNEGERPLQAYIQEFKKTFVGGDFVQISFPRGVNKLEDYRDASSIYSKGTPIQVRGALLYNYHLRRLGLQDKYQPIVDGQKCKFCYLKMPNPIRENVITVPDGLPPEFGLEDYLDRETQFQKTFVEPLRKITTAIGWETEKKASLLDFL